MSNRLIHEDSPYLQQHAHNPVDWYPWGDEAFERAKNEHKAIFISIGYSSCHWCHVMEHEVFEDESIAAYLNAHFICVKVDREERPDIDKHYQEVHALLNRRAGGWPTSIFCTPGLKPFYAATYIPPQPRHNLIGFMQLIEIIAPKIAQRDTELFKNADEIQTYLRPKERPTQAAHLTVALGETLLKQVKNNFEPTYGGFSVAPKFPQVSTLNALMSLYQLSPDDAIASMVTHTLTQMASGGIYDLIDGGFCRYSVDTQWLVPHFEKMTYDNGLLCALYARAYRLFGVERFLHVSREIADFMQGFMMQDQLFYSASDADSEGHEGKYFVYSYEEVLGAIEAAGLDEPRKKAMRLGASPQGNFEGANIIRFMDAETPDWFEAVRVALQKLRTPRVYPFIDRKVQTSWNAMMIKALLQLSRIDERYADQALSSLEALLSLMLIDEQLMHSALCGKAPKIEAFLEDYAYLGVALIEAYELTCNESYLVRAQWLANKALEFYYDAGRWYFSRGEFTTEAEISDSSYPSSVALIVDLLLSLGSLVDEKYRTFAFKTLEYYSADLAKRPLYYPYLCEQALRYIHEDHILKAPFGADVSAYYRDAAHPWLRVHYHEQSDFMLCNNHSCFAKADDIASLLSYN
ncbi:MAG: thioredoxin domain-containing protein [Campylobacterales bacterium]|nr:thioredoxin domain-containing protein [Campylobacterales bacterium]